MKCILCQHHSQLYFDDTKYERDYYSCQNCNLKFLNPHHQLSPKEEKVRYELHVNDPADAGYQKYLEPVRDIILQKYGTNISLEVLDFGSGAHSALEPLFQKLPIEYTAYDLFFKDNKEALNRQYDIIIATEVIEHLADPRAVIEQLKRLTRPDGHIIIMTQFLTDKVNFKDWHYRRDPTHIAFYSPETMNYLKKYFEFSEVGFSGSRLAYFKV